MSSYNQSELERHSLEIHCWCPNEKVPGHGWHFSTGKCVSVFFIVLLCQWCFLESVFLYLEASLL